VVLKVTDHVIRVTPALSIDVQYLPPFGCSEEFWLQKTSTVDWLSARIQSFDIVVPLMVHVSVVWW
jgi:hypothetical protein